MGNLLTYAAAGRGGVAGCGAGATADNAGDNGRQGGNHTTIPIVCRRVMVVLGFVLGLAALL
jgi:hypothetical protein